MVKMGVGQSDMANNTLCRYYIQVQPLLVKMGVGQSDMANNTLCRYCIQVQLFQ